MSNRSLEEGVMALEEEVARLKREIRIASSSIPWWERIFGTFADDPIYEEAMRLGREYRESQRELDSDDE
jgi:hypothetical protein